MTDALSYRIDQLAVRGRREAPALILRDGTLSHEALNLRIAAMADLLVRHGAAPGDRVASWAGKGLLTCLMPLAAARAGLIHVPINPLLKRAQVAHIMADSGSILLIANAARLKALESGDLADTVKTIDETDFVAELSAIAAPERLDPSSGSAQDIAAILYTSGSTGRPKGVVLSHENLSMGAESVAEYLKLTSDDVTLAVLPLSFDYGQNQLLSTWAAGGAVAPLDYLTARDVVKACARHQVTTLAAVPPLWVQLVESDWPEDATASMRRLTNSGGALTEPLVRCLRSLFPAADLYAMYGLTEAFRSTYLAPALIDEKPTSMGQAIPHAEILVVNGEGDVCEPGEHGELVHAGPLVAQGYWRDAERTAERFKPAPAASRYGGMAVWSGDTVYRDTDGLLYFVGREDAMIKTAGNRVSPTEVEEVAVGSGLAVEACALGRPDEKLGAAIVLYVRAAGEADDEGLRHYLKANLPTFMHPAEIVWLANFPKNSNGKIDRTALIAEMTV